MLKKNYYELDANEDLRLKQSIVCLIFSFARFDYFNIYHVSSISFYQKEK